MMELKQPEHSYLNTMVPSQWTKYDPGPALEGEPIWPRVLGYDSTKVFVLSSLNGNSTSYLNSLDLQTGTFSGWQLFYGGAPEAKKMETSDGQIIGLCFVGNKEQNDTFGDLYYIESNDGGLTWSDPFTVYEYNQQDSLGAFRGVDITFLNSDPYIVYEIVKQNFSQQSYDPIAPSKIMLWSPGINGGTSIVIADSNNVPYFPNYSYGDMLAPVCRPVIGTSEDSDILFVAFNAATGYYETFNNIPADTYFAGYFMYSTDHGNTWTMPEKFTPETPLKDWRYISMTSILTGCAAEPIFTLNMIMLADTNAGTNINSPPGEESVSAEIVGVKVNIGFDGRCLSIYYPRENESLIPGTQQFISWFSNDIDTIKIELTTDSGNSWSTIINKTVSDGYIEWYVPNTPSNNCRIKISDVADPGWYEYSGIFTIQNTTLSNETIPDIPKEFALKQNYPNPFNPLTTIHYDIPSGTDVTLGLYNIIGQKIKDLVNEYKSPGKYEVKVDMQEYNSGVYFYKLQAGGYVDTKKMIFMK